MFDGAAALGTKPETIVFTQWFHRNVQRNFLNDQLTKVNFFIMNDDFVEIQLKVHLMFVVLSNLSSRREV